MKKVMFIDDEVLLALAAETSLSASGYEVAIAFDGEEALSKAADFLPDIVVTDLMMPRLDGAGLARELTGRGITAPVVLVTAVPERDLPATTRSLFAACLGKPLDDASLLSCLSSVLAES